MIEAAGFICCCWGYKSELLFFKDSKNEESSKFSALAVGRWPLAVVCSLMLLRPVSAQPQESDLTGSLVQATPTVAPTPIATPIPTAIPLPTPTSAPEATPAPPVVPDPVLVEPAPDAPTTREIPPQAAILRAVSVAAPSNLTASISGNSVVLRWRDNSNNESGFKVERSVSGGGWAELVRDLTPNRTTYTDQSYNPASSTSYRVRSFIVGQANSSYSNTASVVGTISVAAPSNLTAAIRNGSVALGWRDNSNNESGFKVERYTTGAWRELSRGLTPNRTSYTDQSFSPSSRTSYRVRAFVNGKANSSYSNTATVEPLRNYSISSPRTGFTSGAFDALVTRPLIAPSSAHFIVVLQASVTGSNPPSSVRFQLRRPKDGTTSYMTAHATSPGHYSVRWTVDKVLGKRDIKIDPALGTSNQVQVHIAKRVQIVTLARHYAAYEGANPPTSSVGYLACDGFTNTVYGSLGLTGLGLSPTSAVEDNGIGSIRFFKTHRGPALQTPDFTGNGDHVAIRDDPNQIDSNWNNAHAGPTVRDLDHGVGVPFSTAARYWDNAISRAPKGSDASRSILQELDNE